MYLVSFEVDGRGTFLRACSRTDVRRIVSSPDVRIDGDALHVAIQDHSRPLAPASGVHTTVEAVAAWTDGALPTEVAASRLAEQEAAPGRRNAFLRSVRRTLSGGVTEGVLDLAQAAAIARAVMLAVSGVGPAGRRGRTQAHAILSHRDHG